MKEKGARIGLISLILSIGDKKGDKRGYQKADQNYMINYRK